MYSVFRFLCTTFVKYITSTRNEEKSGYLLYEIYLVTLIYKATECLFNIISSRQHVAMGGIICYIMYNDAITTQVTTILSAAFFPFFGKAHYSGIVLLDMKCWTKLFSKEALLLQGGKVLKQLTIDSILYIFTYWRFVSMTIMDLQLINTQRKIWD